MDEHDDLVDGLLTASRVLIGVAVRSIEAAGPAVTPTQHRLMVLLAARGPQTVGVLAEQLNIDSSSATRQCDRLERKNLVVRSRSSADGRVVVVSLTPAGTSLLDTVTTIRRAEIAAIVGRMSHHRAIAAIAALHDFSEAAGELADSDWLGSGG